MMRGIEKMKRKGSLVLVLALLLSILSSCGGGSGGGEKPTADKDTLVVGISTEPATMNPYETSIMYNDAVLRLLYDNLIRLDEDMNYIPHLAESYEAISDTEWKFVLREGIQFSDGTPMTSEDVKASIEATNTSAALTSFAEWLQEVKILDDRTFVIVTKAPSSRLLLDLAQYSYVAPKKIIEDASYNYNENPIGSGPYKLVEWKLGDKLTFVRNDNYFLEEDRAGIEHLVWRIMPEGISRTIALQKGEVNFLYDVQPSDLDKLEKDESVKVFSTPYSSPFYLCFNLKKPGMDNIYVRKAIAAAINRENAVLLATNGYATPIISCAASGLLGSTDENAQSYNVEKAKEYMELSGLPEDQRTFNVITREDPFKIALESIQADLKEIGIELVIDMVDSATYTARGADGDFDMITGKSGVADILVYANSAFKTGAFVNFNFLNDPYVDQLIETGSQTLNVDEREKIVKELVSYCNENCFRTGIYQLATIRAYDANLAGFETNLISLDRYNKIYWK